AAPITLLATTAPAEASESEPDAPFSFLALSCFAPFSRGQSGRVSLANRRTLHALERTAQRSDDARPAFALGMGDQVYVDDGAWKPFHRPAHSLLRGGKSDRLAYPKDLPDPFFDRLYRAHFSLGPFAAALRHIPSAMMWDDHEIRDGWGSHGDEGAAHWRAHATSARRHFVSYQLLRSARCFDDRNDSPLPPVEGEPGGAPAHETTHAPDEQGRWPSLHYRFDWGKSATFFVMDQRSQRSCSVDAGAEGESVLGERQRAELADWLWQPEGRTPRLFVLVSPVPLTTPGWFRVDPASWLRFRRDDRRDRWWSRQNRRQAMNLLSLLAERFGQSHDRLLILSGDVHYSEVRELRLPQGGPVFGHEVISSGLAQSSYQTWYRPMHELNEWRPAFPELIESVSLGRHLGSGFAELHVVPSRSAEETPELRVLFHFGDSQRDTELSRWLGKRKDTPDSVERWRSFELDPLKHGALLDLRPRSSAAEGPVRSCLRALGSDRVRAIMAHEREIVRERRHRRALAEAELDGHDMHGEARVRAADQSGQRSVRVADLSLSGLALSGGGIRSATTSIGFMQVLQQHRELESFDFASSVSGGSYANGYLQVMSSPELLRRMDRPADPKHMLDDAFSDAAVYQLHTKSRYLARGTGLTGAFNMVRLATSFLTSLIQHWLWLASVLVTLGFLGKLADRPLRQAVVGLSALGAVSILFRMLLAHDTRRFKPRLLRLLEDGLNRAESVILLGLALLGGPLLWQGLPDWLDAERLRVKDWAVEQDVTAGSIVLTIALSMVVPIVVTTLWKRGLRFSTRLAQGLSLGLKAMAGLVFAVLVAVGIQHALHGLHDASVQLGGTRSGSLFSDWLGPVGGFHRDLLDFVISAAITVFLTLITSPNSTSLHRYYAARLADAFLTHPPLGTGLRAELSELKRLHRGLSEEPMLLHDLARSDSRGPYPLFNGCVNLVGKDPEFAGDQTSDYFLFAPHHCGAKLTGYARTAPGEQYGRLTLAEAVTCSGAAISPFQGRSMPSATSTLLWLLNLRTDLWLPNPGSPRRGFWGRVLDAHTLPWGPIRQVLALCGKLDTRARFVNVSDGGFIDNLGVYELLRRRCQCIVAIDATWDPRYEFEYLRNLIVRARQELNVDFEFDEQPELVIKPRVTDGLSEKCVITATIKWPARDGLPDGQLFYVKAALPRDRMRSAAGQKAADPSRAYRTYHPSFPQESTGDQFFDPVQSQAYHELGRLLANELLEHPAWLDRRHGSPTRRASAHATKTSLFTVRTGLKQ
ncbi:MAG: hypothetical protein RLZZ450_4365, partial [Pseudomonadota bacterium]